MCFSTPASVKKTLDGWGSWQEWQHSFLNGTPPLSEDHTLRRQLAAIRGQTIKADRKKCNSSVKGLGGVQDILISPPLQRID